jgi:hypothetical protein
MLVTEKLDSLKKMAISGDLIVRLGDDVLSYQIKYLNEKDQRFSHAGMIIEKDNQKFVVHLGPEENGGDSIRYLPVDSFLNPAKNLNCALYRYDFNAAERSGTIHAIENFKSSGVHFDWLYDLSTSKKMYCSEMISRAIEIGTHGRIICETTQVPQKMQPLLYTYFKKDHLTKKDIAERKIISIDNLYTMPSCTQIMTFPLQYFPGE